MSICEHNQEILELYALGLAELEELDQLHTRWCPSCKKALKQARSLRGALTDYASQVDQEADRLLASRTSPVPYLTRLQTKSWQRWLPWLVAAASLLFALALWVFQPRSDLPPSESAYLAALEAEASRLEVLSYLNRTQMFLISLMDESLPCSEISSLDTDRQIARRLIYQKRLLQPKLASLHLDDIVPLLDDLELLLLEVANSQDCADLQLWRSVIRSRSTLMKLNLLQMEGRI
jgi:hypothetical protein